MIPLEIVVSPGGHLIAERSGESVEKRDVAKFESLEVAFGVSVACGLELLAGEFLNESVSPSVGFWREFARSYFTRLCHTPDVDAVSGAGVAKPTGDEWVREAETAPPMKGLEYLTVAVLGGVWDALDGHVREQVGRTDGGAQAYLRAMHPAWNLVGRVTFHLAENKRNTEYPFAFLATYTHRLSERGNAQHIPLGRALEEYAGARNRAALTSLLSPVQLAAEKSKLARELLDSRAIFHPQAWRPAQAYRFLKEIPLFEEGGVSVRIPDWWKAGRPPRPTVSVRIGDNRVSSLGADGLLDFNVEMTLDGQVLSEAEWKAILNSTNGLVFLKGKWIEADPEQLREVLDHWKKMKATSAGGGLTFLESLRLLSGLESGPGRVAEDDAPQKQWSSVVAGDWLKKVLEQMQDPQSSKDSDPGPDLLADLRPYQRKGSHWLWFMSQLGLGACLADDMGLGKTVQVISLLVTLKQAKATQDCPRTSLLLVPASLIANWKAELRRFAPSLLAFFAHPSETPPERLAAVAKDPEKALKGCDLVITSYGMAQRLAWFKARAWNLVILDEAQAIKNPAARQTRAAKELRARSRIALSGTPIENSLSDLWSLFDFLCPGLLGGAKEFSAFVKTRSQLGREAFAPLRRLVRPYILRRLKTDKRVVSDLPDKTELSAFCSLSREQAVLYQQGVEELDERLNSQEIEGIQRRGVILAFLMRFKQICNHPSQWLGDGGYKSAASGKFQRLTELCEQIAAKQEKVLVFTQYREITEALTRHLAEVFGRPGLVLHGGIAVKKRQVLVNEFQEETGPPFFVLSLKAGGTGLNLTAASHVIHFDRWWNPAVENQATDRAFRIGQRRNVMVHKFVCRGTLEERIHDMIVQKTSLAEDILGDGPERLLTEMGNSELLQFVALDIKAASGD